MLHKLLLIFQAIEEDGTQQNSHVVGSHFLSEMLVLRDEFDVVGDVRGKGLMLGLELVTDKVCLECYRKEVFPIYSFRNEDCFREK